MELDFLTDMKRKVFLQLFMLLFTIAGFSQITDTVYFDLQGEIIIKEVASMYRVAQFDTITGNIDGLFYDYKIPSDSLLGSGSYYINPEGEILIENFTGDSNHYDVAIVMQDLKASFIRINDYPYLKKIIKPYKSIEDRTIVKSKNNQMEDFIIVEEEPEFPGGWKI